MTEAARQLAQRTEDRLEKVSETVRERFEEITKRRFADLAHQGLFADQPDQGSDRARAEIHQGRPGGPG
ncbi:hypothetical protein E1211_30680 [Micromonospora sp. 15K316]|uniref:hypothetical protein n=1 Tax=Micromonospora sp. 15K316 TaxID=2530376 RepID=UPI001052C7F8|nr:hypothetical protein [Micromonospora sp. 15K316]TDC25774.1 hypothetical protein E1211_30680 [Micromonospora sp. 15K316]